MKSNIYLAKPSGELIGCPNGIKTDTVNVKFHATDIWEMSFEVNRYINDTVSGSLVPSDYYDSIRSGMKLYLDDAMYPAYFIINEEPVSTIDGNFEMKSVTCHSCECELQNSFKTLQINTGIKGISAEYLIDQNVDSYTGLPKEYISLVNYNEPQKSLMHLILEGTGWKTAPNIKEEVCQRKYAFQLEHADIYSFLTQSLAGTCQCFIVFDRKNKTVSLIDKNDYGKDTGIFLSYRSLLNKLDKSPMSDHTLATKMYPSGKEDLSIYYANFGQSFLVDYDYYANAKDEYGNAKFISNELADKYNTYLYETDQEKVSWNGNEYTRRELYMDLSRKYNMLLLEETELIHRVPNDGCIIDYKTFKYDELITALKAYHNALYALITIFRNEYGIEDSGDLSTADEEKMKATVYWYDYTAYKNTILPKIYEALKIWCKTNSNGDLCDKNGNSLTIINEKTLVPYNGGLTTNPAYSDTLIKQIDAYSYDFDLYGLDELNAKRLAWLTTADTLYTDGFILEKDESGNPLRYNTPDEEGWNALENEIENIHYQKNFTDKFSFIEKLNQYLNYMSSEERENAITGRKEKGIVRQCEDKIRELEAQISEKRSEMASVDSLRKDLSSRFTFYNYFTEEERKTFTTLTKEIEYQNNNILLTSLDNTVTQIDRQNELYLDAKNILYMNAHPQWHFQIEADNLFDIPEMSNIAHDFHLGNYIRVQTDLYKDEFVKLRLISVETNPCEATERLNIEFSDTAYTYRRADDFDYIFSKLYKGASTSGSGSGISSSSGNSTSNNRDAIIQISSNMLNALLSSEQFGTSITDAVLNSITANKGNFQDILAANIMANSVSVGKTVIDGRCLTTGQIKSADYNGSQNDSGICQIDNTSGSILSLDNGTFNFGGGGLTWDGHTLHINGDISGSTGTFQGMLNVNDKFKVDESGNVTAEGFLKASNAEITGKITTTSATFDGITTNKATITGGVISDTTIQNSRLGNFTVAQNTNHGITYAGSGASCGMGYKKMENIDPNEPVTGDPFLFYAFWADTNQNGIHPESAKFYVTNSGYLHCVNAQTDNLTASRLDATYIGPFELGYQGLWAGDEETLIVDGNGEGYIQNIKLKYNEMACGGAYSQRSFSGLSKRTLYVGSNGLISAASSSKRYKQDISDSLSDFDIHAIYKLPVVQFRYNKENGGGDGSELHIGLLAEDVAKYFPTAARWDKNHEHVDTWEPSDLFPAVVKLVQEQHKEIEELKQRIKSMETKLSYEQELSVSDKRSR